MMVCKNKLLIYVPSLSGGGAEKMIINLANYFTEKGIYVDLILARDINDYPELINKKINLINLTGKNRIQRILFLAKYIRNVKPVSLLTTLMIANWEGTVANILSFSKVKHYSRITYHISESYKNNPTVKKRIDSYFIPIMAKLGVKFIGLSKDVSNDININLGVAIDKISTVYNPAFTEEMMILAKETVSDPWFNADYDIIISPCRLVKTKDLTTLIKAFRLVKNGNKTTKLVFLGKGPEKANLRLLVNKLDLGKDVRFLDFDPNPYKYISKAKIMVSCSLQEAFGNVIVESLALNVHVISSNCPGGPVEILENGKWGKLFPVGDHIMLAQHVLDTIQEPKRTDLLDRARDFSVKNIAEEYADKLSLLLDNSM